MIAFTRDLARRFRAVAKKCVSGRPRGPAPPVACRQVGGVLTLTACLGEVAVAVSAPGAGGADEVLVVPMAVLEAVEGAGDEPVELERTGGLTGVARYPHRGVPRSLPIDLLQPSRRHEPLSLPPDTSPVPAELLRALHECGRTAAREATRFALNRVQVRGTAGQVIGTDGRQALIWNGLRLPFAADLLVPAVPAFGSRELTGEANVRVGRADGHLVVAAGPWAVWLALDTTGRFPDVAGVLPRPGGSSAAGIDGRDAAALLDALPELPGAADPDSPVTLDLDGGVAVRAGAGDEVVEVRLSRSPAAGPPARAAVDRAVLRRALGLSCHTLRLSGEGRPVVLAGDGPTLVTVALDPSAVTMPAQQARVIRTDPAAPVTHRNRPRRTTPMKSHETNGRPDNGRHDPPPTDGPDPLVEAEALRASLADTLARAGRLVAALKHTRRQKKALDTVVTTLRQLNLGP